MKLLYNFHIDLVFYILYEYSLEITTLASTPRPYCYVIYQLSCCRVSKDKKCLIYWTSSACPGPILALIYVMWDPILVSFEAPKIKF